MGSSHTSITKEQSSFFIEEAIKNDDVNVFKAFYEKYGTVNVTIRGDSFLILCCKSGSVKIFDFLMEKGVDVNYRNYSDESALFVASERGNLKMVETLYVNGKFDCHNIENNIGYTPFMIACKNDKADVAEFLYNCGGCDINKTTKVFGTSAIQMAVFFKCKGVIEFFERRIFKGC